MKKNDSKNYNKNVIGICPLCKGRVIEQKTKTGKVVFSCENYKTCDFKIWQEIAGAKLSSKTVTQILGKGKTSKKLKFQKKDGTFYEAYLKLDKDKSNGVSYLKMSFD